MILADTSVWIDLFRRGDSELQQLLQEGSVVMHDFVLGELACGGLGNRERTLFWLQKLPRIATVFQSEVLAFIESHRLFGVGLGWTDIHLLAAARLHDCQLYTRDQKLREYAIRLGVDRR